MDEDERELIRRLFLIPQKFSDEDIDEREIYLQNAHYLKTPNFIRVANFIVLESVRKNHYPTLPRPGMNPFGQDLFWLFRCECFFIDGHYGPCCVWARATLEFELQEICLSRKDASSEFRTRIQDRAKRNPGIEGCLNELAVATGSSVHDACMKIKNNGDRVIHHRLDRMKDGSESLEDWLMELGLSKGFAGVLSKMDERELMKSLRHNWERDRAIESMDCLYMLITTKFGEHGPAVRTK